MNFKANGESKIETEELYFTIVVVVKCALYEDNTCVVSIEADSQCFEQQIKS